MNVEKMQKPLRPSLFTEVNGLVKAFNFLTSSLLAMRAYMPESMFVKGTTDIDGDEEETGTDQGATIVPGIAITIFEGNTMTRGGHGAR